MSTRKLVLTALVCGIAIILAGGFKLLQVATDAPRVEVLAWGTPATLGDMTVAVEKVEKSTDATLVTVTMRGVALAEGAFEGWRMLAEGRVFTPLTQQTATDACQAVSATAEVRCTVTFDPTTATPTVAYLRAGAQQQWGTEG